jgi:hypothetical protein
MKNESKIGTVLVTGASSGIGRALAEEFANHGYDIVLVARNVAKLTEVENELGSKVSARIILKDLAVPSAPKEIYDQLRAENINIDVLVNCAGFGLTGQFSKTDIQSELDMLQVNIVALTYLTKLFLIDMMMRREGKILNVASTAAFEPGPLMSVYHATKAYVLNFSEAIAEEVKGCGVTVTTLCPGPTKTGFSDTARNDQSRLFVEKAFIRVQNPKTVAKVAYAGLMKGSPVVIPGFTNKLVPLAAKLVPRRMLLKIVKKMYEAV